MWTDLKITWTSLGSGPHKYNFWIFCLIIALLKCTVVAVGSRKAEWAEFPLNINNSQHVLACSSLVFVPNSDLSILSNRPFLRSLIIGQTLVSLIALVYYIYVLVKMSRVYQGSCDRPIISGSTPVCVLWRHLFEKGLLGLHCRLVVFNVADRGQYTQNLGHLTLTPEIICSKFGFVHFVVLTNYTRLSVNHDHIVTTVL